MRASSARSPAWPNGGWPRSCASASASARSSSSASCAGDRARDLRHLEAVGQPGAVVVALVEHEHLRLVGQPPEGRRMHDAVAVALEQGSASGSRARREARPAARTGAGGIGRAAIASVRASSRAVSRQVRRPCLCIPGHSQPRLPRSADLTWRCPASYVASGRNCASSALDLLAGRNSGDQGMLEPRSMTDTSCRSPSPSAPPAASPRSWRGEPATRHAARERRRRRLLGLPVPVRPGRRARRPTTCVIERAGARVLIDPVSLEYPGRLGDRLRRRPDRRLVQDQEPATRPPPAAAAPAFPCRPALR